MADLPYIKNLSDAELISLYKKSGNQAIIGELYERYIHLVFGVCLKYLKHHENARDASVEIFEQLLTKLKSHEVSNFKSWLYSVAKNHCLMQLRKEKNHIELHDDVNEIVESSSELHPSSVNEKEEQLVRLEEAIKQLNDDQRRCVEFFYLQELSYQQITDKTGFTFGEVKSFIQNGKRNLKIVMSKAYERKTS
ncbi:MAG TPA: sigma-70 family RNA polymerase sigma factor [Chitinophagales bacterium]|nr:sigma-70 family RNA polymerase sigma factor [Chitinophagales bacterium]